MKNILKIALALFIIHHSSFITIQAQVSINTDNSDPDGSAMLDVQSTDKGMLIPRMDSTSRNAIAAPATGLLVYDSTTTSFWYYDEMQWNEIRNGSDTLTSDDLFGSSSAISPCLETESSLNIGAFPRSVAISGNYAYVINTGDDVSNLRVIDVNDPLNPSQVSSQGGFDTPEIVKVQGNYAYVTDNGVNEFVVVDVSNPTNPNRAGAYATTGSLGAFDVQGDYAYLLDVVQDSFIVIDVGSPSNPTSASNLHLGGNPKHVAVSGDYAFTTNVGLLEIIDISNPNNVSLVNQSLNVGGGISDMIASGNYVYLLDNQTNMLKIVDVSNPNNPSFTADLNIGNTPKSIAVDGDYIFIVDTQSDDLKVVYVGDPNNPILLESLAIGSNPQDVAAAQNKAYVVDRDSDDLKIISICEIVELVGVNNATNSFIRLAPSTIDDQTVDKLNLNGTTLELSLENDGQPDQTVDLASIDTDTDDQTIDKLNLNGTTLELSLENDGQADQTVDLASIDTDTDDQTIDKLNLNGTTLELSLENDGQADQTLDLSSLAPVGSVMMYYGTTAPSGWLICDGSTFNAAIYPKLNTLLGGNTLPDFSGRFPLGVGNSGTAGSTNHALSTTGGEEAHTLTTGEMPVHGHTVSIGYREGTEQGSGNDYSDLGAPANEHTHNQNYDTSLAGNGNAHNNMPPFLTINFIIKAE